jgi:membrane protease YdiL (CAAX protease family)
VIEERLTPPWEPWEAVPVALGAFLATLVVSVVLAAVVGIGGVALLIVGLVFQLSLAGFSMLWVAVRHRGWVPALGLRTRRPASDIFIGAFAGAGLFALVAFLEFPLLVLLFEGLVGHPPNPINQLPFELSPGLIVLSVIVVVVGAPFGEEIFFRGFLYGSLRSRFGYPGAASISSAVFGLFHAGVSWLLVPLMFVVGMGLSFLYERRGTLATSIAAHAAFNIVGFTLIVLSRM